MKRHDVLLLISPVPQNRVLGIAGFAKAHGWNITIGDRSAPPSGWRGDGVLVMLKDDARLIRYIRSLKRRQIAVVDLSVFCPHIRLPRVIGDNEAIGRLAARHFLERHFVRAAFFASKRSHVHDLRYRGFAGIWTQAHTGETPARWSPGVLASALGSAPKPIGVFCYSDYDASLVLNACLSRRIRVPEEVAILGVDNNEILCENQTVPLSSVLHDHEEVGRRGAELLEKLMCEHRRSRPPSTLSVLPKRVVTRKSTDITAANDPIVRQALGYIAANLSRPFGLAQIAAEIGIANYRLTALFRKELGWSVGREIMRQRLSLARKLLLDGDQKVSEIASETGFCNIAYFINTFRRETGLTPRQYRSRLR